MLEAADLIARRAEARRALSATEMLRLLGRLKDGDTVKLTVRSSEVLRLNTGKHAGLVRIYGVSEKELEGSRLNDARTQLQRGDKTLKQRIRLSPSEIAGARAEKFLLGPLGELTASND